VNNGQILTGTVPDQFSDALTFLNEVTSRVDPLVNPISLTGHSLGGSLASLVGAYTGTTAEVFNALGVSKLLPALGLDPSGNYNNIENHNAYFDPAYRYTSLLGGDQIGLVTEEFVSALAYVPDWLEPLAPVIFPLLFAQFVLGQHSMDSLLAVYRSALSATVPPRRYDPLTLDLDGDGLETTALNGGTFFDQDANGFAEQTGWVGKDDGLLVWDRNNDGQINDGRELFGDRTALQNGALAQNGFAALAEWDGNLDGKIDQNDAVWANLKVWRDTDGDAISTAPELHTLDAFGIQGIDLGYIDTNAPDGQGNTQTRLGSFTKIDGTTGQVGEYQFERSTTYTVATDPLDVPLDIADLPDIRGYGSVYSLQQAMVRDTSGQLKTLVESFVAETNPGNRNTLLEQILFNWTGSNTIDPASRGGNFDARKLSVLEKFYGRDAYDAKCNIYATSSTLA
jgi:hypothetical protein